MNRENREFLNFSVDHMTLLVSPEMYNFVYVLFRVIFGANPEDVIYNVKKEWRKGEGERSLTFATRVGKGADENEDLNSTMIAVVQPSEPKDQSSHVRNMLSEHQAAAHWQHIALKTPDLLAFHKHALERGVRFITPILKDSHDDLIQVFSGEWYFPGSKPSGMFFEFVQRDPSETLLRMLEERNRETFFRDKTFLGLYGEKENEYQSGKITPFVDFQLYYLIMGIVGNKQMFEIDETDIRKCEDLMLTYGKEHPTPQGIW